MATGVSGVARGKALQRRGDVVLDRTSVHHADKSRPRWRVVACVEPRGWNAWPASHVLGERIGCAPVNSRLGSAGHDDSAPSRPIVLARGCRSALHDRGERDCRCQARTEDGEGAFARGEEAKMFRHLMRDSRPFSERAAHVVAFESRVDPDRAPPSAVLGGMLTRFDTTS